MKRPSKAKKLPGIYTRGETFWFTYRLNGKKHFHSLGTSDYGEAVQKALAIRENPELTPAAVFEQEIAAFIVYKVARDDYSRFSAENKVYALRRFAKVTGRANPSLVTPADVETFYRGERARIEEGSVRSYLATVRSFLQLAGEIAQDAPQPGGKAGIRPGGTRRPATSFAPGSCVTSSLPRLPRMNCG